MWGVVVFVMVLSVAAEFQSSAGLGVNWGEMASHKLPPETVIQMLKDNGITKVKLFDTDSSTLRALAGTGIEVMVAIPNVDLAAINDYQNARKWVTYNLTRYLYPGGVDIKYVAVGNEPFLAAYDGMNLNTTFPALCNIRKSLIDAGIGDIVKVTVPFNADVYGSPTENPVPSAGRFRPEIADLMTDISRYLYKHNSPFLVNIYPFLSLYYNREFPVDFAFFDGTENPVFDAKTKINYTNVLDANFDTLISALKRIGLGKMDVMIGEIGWPTDGDINANVLLAKRFYQGLFKQLAVDQGTPLRPNKYIETYLFSLIDENKKSIAPGNFERHWGIFTYDGRPKFQMDISGEGLNTTLIGAKEVKYLRNMWCVLNPKVKYQIENQGVNKLGDNIKYACQTSDCTALGYGSSCHGIDVEGNASYAFNMYFQVHNQAEKSCDFDGLAIVTFKNASREACKFIVQVDSLSSSVQPSIVHLLILSLIFLVIHPSLYDVFLYR